MGESTVSLRLQNASETIVSDMGEDLIEGTEKYPIIGNLLSEKEAEYFITLCIGLQTSANCYEKAMLVFKNQHLLSVISEKNKVRLCLGAIRVWSTDGRSAYGHDFNPPHELHAWIEVDDKIIDISLPGVIIRGINYRDQEGPVLIGRTPFILAGKVPKWIHYKTAEKYYTN